MKTPRLRRLALIFAVLLASPALVASPSSAQSRPSLREMGPLRNMNVVRTLDGKSLLVTADTVTNARKYVVSYNGVRVYEGRDPHFTDTNRALGVGTHVYSMFAVGPDQTRTSPHVAAYTVSPYPTILPPIQNTAIGSVRVDLSEQRIYVFGTQAIFPSLLAIILMSSGTDGSTPTGVFSVRSKSASTFYTPNPGERMDNMVRFAIGRNDGNIGFHSIPYTLKNGVKQYFPTPLGIAPSSHGCIRLNDYAAAWLFNNIAIGTRVSVVD